MKNKNAYAVYVENEPYKDGSGRVIASYDKKECKQFIEDEELENAVVKKYDGPVMTEDDLDGCDNGCYYVLTGYDPKDEDIQGPYRTFDAAQLIADQASEACYNYAYVCDKDGNRIYDEY